MHQTYSGECPISVRRASMTNRWSNLTFLHWDYDPDVVQALLPPGLTVHTFDDRAWVALVPFMMQVRAARGPAVPWLSNFCETNVRTYATAPDGTAGVWFLSLDAARLAAVVAARAAYRLPYFWSDMSLETTDGAVHYKTVRRLPGPKGARSTVVVRPGRQYAPDELGAFDHFLTARWRLYSARRAGLRHALAAHAPWPLYRATVDAVADDLVQAAGLPAPAGEPVVHWSPGVDVRIGFPHRVRDTAAR